MNTEGPIQALSPEQQLSRLEQLDSTHPAKEKGFARFSGKEVKVALLSSLPFVLAGLLTLLTSFFLPIGLAFGLATAGYFAAGTFASATIFSKLLSDRKAEAIPAENVLPYMKQRILKSTAGNASETGSSKQTHGAPVVNKAKKEPSKPLLSDQEPDAPAASDHKALPDQNLNPASEGVLPDNPDSLLNTDNSIESPDSPEETPVTPVASKDNAEHLAENTSTQNTETHETENAELAIMRQRENEEALLNKLTNELFISLRNKKYPSDRTVEDLLESIDSAFGDEISSTESDQSFSSDYNSSDHNPARPAKGPLPSEPEDDGYGTSEDFRGNPSATGSIPLTQSQEQPSASGKTNLRIGDINPLQDLDDLGELSSLSSSATIDDDVADPEEGTGNRGESSEASESTPIVSTATTREEQPDVAEVTVAPQTGLSLPEKLTLQKQPEHKTTPGIGGKENKKTFQRTATHTDPTYGQSAEKPVPSAPPYDLIAHYGNAVPEPDHTSTALIRASAKPVDTIHGNNTTGLMPGARGKTLYFKVKLFDSGNKVQMRLTPDNNLIRPDSSQQSSLALTTLADNTYRNVKISFRINGSDPSSFNVITIGHQATPDELAALDHQVEQQKTFDLSIDKSEFPALYSNKQLAQGGDKAFDKLETTLEIDAPAKSHRPVEKALPVSRHPIKGTDQHASINRQLQASIKKDRLHGVFESVKEKPANFQFKNMFTGKRGLTDLIIPDVTKSPSESMREQRPKPSESPARFPTQREPGALADKATPAYSLNIKKQISETMASEAIDDLRTYSEVNESDEGAYLIPWLFPKNRPLPPVYENTDLPSDVEHTDDDLTTILYSHGATPLDSEPLTSDDEAPPLLPEKRTGTPTKRSAGKTIRSQKVGLFSRLTNFLPDKFQSAFSKRPAPENYPLVNRTSIALESSTKQVREHSFTDGTQASGSSKKAAASTVMTDDQSFEQVVTPDILKQYYNNTALLTATDAAKTGASKNLEIKETLIKDKELLSQPALTGTDLTDQLIRDAYGKVLDVRLKKSDGSMKQISHQDLSDFTGTYKEQAKSLVADLYDKVDDYLESEGVANALRRNHLRDVMLNFSHQGAFVIHYSLGKLIADTYIENLKGQLGTSTDFARLYKSNELMDIVTPHEDKTAFTIKPAEAGRLTHVEFRIDKDKQNLTIKKLYECPLILFKHANNSPMSDAPKRVSIEAHYKLGLLSDEQNGVVRVTAVEVNDHEGSAQQHNDPVVLFDGDCQPGQDNITGL